VGAADTAASTAELLSDYLDQRPFASAAVEFAVENLFPWSEIQFAFGVHQTKTFHYAAPMDEFLDLRRNIDEPASIWNFKPKMFSE